MNRGTAKIAYAVVNGEKGRTKWLRIGRATVNADGSLDVRLDAVPIDGRIQIRDEPCDLEGDHPGVKGEPPRHDGQAASDCSVCRAQARAQGAGE